MVAANKIFFLPKNEIFRKVIVLDDISDETILSSISYRNCRFKHE